jgi:hypothetical protein
MRNIEAKRKQLGLVAKADVVTSQESSACMVLAHSSAGGIAKVTAVSVVNERGVVKTLRRKPPQ